jgi:hypothetical protein
MGGYPSAAAGGPLTDLRPTARGLLRPGRAAAVAFGLLALAEIKSAQGAGPSFDCATPQAPIDRFICADSSLAEADLANVQAAAIFAVTQNLNPDEVIRQRYGSVLTAAQNACELPKEGLPTNPDAKYCVLVRLESFRGQLLGNLTGAASEEADRDPAQNILLQRALIQRGVLKSVVWKNGTLGPKSREAIKKFQKASGLPETGFLDDTTASALLPAPDRPVAADNAGSRPRPIIPNAVQPLQAAQPSVVYAVASAGIACLVLLSWYGARRNKNLSLAGNGSAALSVALRVLSALHIGRAGPLLDVLRFVAMLGMVSSVIVTGEIKLALWIASPRWLDISIPPLFVRTDQVATIVSAGMIGISFLLLVLPGRPRSWSVGEVLRSHWLKATAANGLQAVTGLLLSLWDFGQTIRYAGYALIAFGCGKWALGIVGRIHSALRRMRDVPDEFAMTERRRW